MNNSFRNFDLIILLKALLCFFSSCRNNEKTHPKTIEGVTSAVTIDIQGDLKKG